VHRQNLAWALILAALLLSGCPAGRNAAKHALSDADKKIVQSALLDAARSNGKQGVHAQLERFSHDTDHKAIAKYFEEKGDDLRDCLEQQAMSKEAREILKPCFNDDNEP
jgi:hypothetical protein